MKPIRQSILSILPPLWRQQFPDKLLEDAEEIRLRLGRPVTLRMPGGWETLSLTAGEEELRFVLTLASR